MGSCPALYIVTFINDTSKLIIFPLVGAPYSIFFLTYWQFPPTCTRVSLVILKTNLNSDASVIK